jgi:Peptidase A4 family
MLGRWGYKQFRIAIWILGLLAPSSVIAQSACPTNVPPNCPLANGQLTLPANQEWCNVGRFNSALELTITPTSQTQTVYIGAVSLGQPNISDYQTPGGDPSTTTAAQTGHAGPFAAPGLIPWSLVGKVGANGVPFEIGYGATISTVASDCLYLSVNDNNFSDNSGSWQIGVSPNSLIYNNTWAGYLEFGSYTSVSATWVVPAASYVDYTNFSFGAEATAVWIGIGGRSSPLIQLGTNAVSTPAGLLYYAWYQTVPPSISPTYLLEPVKPNDVVSASIECLYFCKTPYQEWQLSMTDWSAGWSWPSYPLLLNTQPPSLVLYDSKEDSAEWIVEAPELSLCAIQNPCPLLNFGTATFSAVTANGQLQGTLPYTDAIWIDQATGGIAVPSPETALGAFNVCWGSSAPLKGAEACTVPASSN